MVSKPLLLLFCEQCSECEPLLHWNNEVFLPVSEAGDSPGQWGHWGSSLSAEAVDASSGPEHSPAGGQPKTNKRDRGH